MEETHGWCMKSTGGQLRRWSKHSGEISGIGKYGIVNHQHLQLIEVLGSEQDNGNGF